MTRTPAGIELAIKRLELMRERCNQTQTPKTHETLLGDARTAGSESRPKGGGMSMLRRINFGTLPSKSYLAIVVEHEGLPEGATSVDHLYREMVQLKNRGSWSLLRTLLERVGIEWGDPATATAEARRS